MIRSLLRLPGAALLAGLLLSACDGPTAPARLLAEAVEGNAQEALPGDTLPRLIGVRVTRADGSPAAGVAVRFRAADGAGTVVATAAATDSYGMARATWRLPTQAGAELVVTAEAEGAAQPARFTAGWLPRERADLLIGGVSGRVRLLLHPPAYMGSPLAFQAAFQDSTIITPFNGGSGFAEGVAFTDGRPPLILRDLRWTPGRDTLRLEFPPPVEVPLSIWIVLRPYNDVRAAMETQLEAARAVWGRAGVRFSDVRWIDATQHPDADLMQGPTPACGPRAGGVGGDAGRTNIYVTGPPVYGGHTYSGYACNAALVFVTVSRFLPSLLLAHELGHTFGLGHEVAESVMGTLASDHLTAGQIFRAHAYSTSAIQTLYADRTSVPAITCFVPGSCLQTGFDM